MTNHDRHTPQVIATDCNAKSEGQQAQDIYPLSHVVKIVSALLLVASIKYMRYHLSMTTAPLNNQNNELNDRASLIASLTAFSLQQILHIIIESSQDGELYVGGTDQDGRAWIKEGKIIGFSVSTLDDSTASAEKALFELALFDNAWAYFTLGRSAPTSTCSEDLRVIVDRIGPQLEEYRSLIEKIPLNATVQLNQDSPSDSVQMSSSQWKVLTRIGSKSGQQVREIVSSTDTSQVDTLKILDQLLEAQLIIVDQDTHHEATSKEALPDDINNINNSTSNTIVDAPNSSTIGASTTPTMSSTMTTPPSEPSLSSIPTPSTEEPPSSGHSLASAPDTSIGSTTTKSTPTNSTSTPTTPDQSAGSVPLGSVNSSEPDREVTNALRETVDPLGGFILVTDSPAKYDTRPEKQFIDTNKSDDMQFPTGLGDI